MEGLHLNSDSSTASLTNVPATDGFCGEALRTDAALADATQATAARANVPARRMRLVVGVSGASGAPLAIELLRQLRSLREHAAPGSPLSTLEVHLVVTRGGELTLEQESGMELSDLKKLADVVHDNSNIGASIASGSFKTLGMVVVPCSMKTLAGIVSGYSDNLLLRAADVCLKERRKLVLVTREAPLSNIHLRNMYEASQAGAVILPPMLTYYNHPQTVEDCTRHIACKILDQFDLDGEGYIRWQ